MTLAELVNALDAGKIAPALPPDPNRALMDRISWSSGPIRPFCRPCRHEGLPVKLRHFPFRITMLRRDPLRTNM